ncbi:MAG: M20/M25/M40 family metallo-hydrolase [Desulfocapsaceae bacterium]|nr:M20/M25/M40 family metallo-hydrolase [Desulfocapsaceae bacterium]
MINRERLAGIFAGLCETDSPSRREGRMAALLREQFTLLGADSIEEDGSAARTGSDTGNLIVRFNGSDPSRQPLFFSCHMDTVEPGTGVQVVRNGDIFTSRGNTVLGSDDKSGIAALIELMTVLSEDRADHGCIELVFTTCEEIGLLGAKHLAYERLRAQLGYALDTTGIDRVITGAPASNHLKIFLHGIAAHAGLNPEDGVSALSMAAAAIARLRLGRLDAESTANLGLINGGVATNIVPALLAIEGEVRSHSTEKLAAYTDTLVSAFRKVVGEWPVPPGAGGQKPWVDIQVQLEYPSMLLHDDDPVLDRIRRAGLQADRDLQFLVAGGGSDANILNSYGLSTAIVATGMHNVHTTEEYLDLNDAVSLTELLHAIVTVP